MVHIPYKGLAPALTDVLAGHVDMMFDNIGNTLQPIKQGRVRGLAVASKERLPELPGVPTLAETYPGFYSATWFAIVAPPPRKLRLKSLPSYLTQSPKFSSCQTSQQNSKNFPVPRSATRRLRWQPF